MAILVNGKPLDEFFGRETARMVVRQPLELTERVEIDSLLGEQFSILVEAELAEPIVNVAIQVFCFRR